MENRYKIIYDIKQRNIVNARFKQGDVDSSVLEVTIVDGGLPVNITGEAIEFRFLKPDNTIVYQDSLNGVTILDATIGKVECVLKSNTLAKAGIVKCEIHRELAGKELTTPTFTFTVEASIGDDGIASTNYISIVEQIRLAYEEATHENTAVELVDARYDSVNDFTYNNIGDRMDATATEINTLELEVDKKISKDLATDSDQVLVSTGISAWAVKTLAQIKTWLGLGTAAYTDSSDYETPLGAQEKADAAGSAALSAAIDYTDQEVGALAGEGNTKTVKEVADELLSHKDDITTHGGIYHKNLLHNWDFRNPVNQRGQSSYSGTGYTIDRWRSGNGFGIVTINNDYITFSANGGNAYLSQYLEQDFSDFAGEIITVSALLSNGTVYSATATLPQDKPVSTAIFATVDCVSANLEVAFSVSLDKILVQFALTDGNEVDVVAVKLEKGSVSTLANDPPADYGEQLALCQRYYRKVYLYNPVFLADDNQFGIPYNYCGMRIEKPTAYTINDWYFHTANETEPIHYASGNSLEAIRYSGIFKTVEGLVGGNVYSINTSSIANNRVSDEIGFVLDAEL